MTRAHPSIDLAAVRALLDEFESLPPDDPRRVEIMAQIRMIGERAVLQDLPAQTEH